jgi:uncharacterized repeat protein (TIGR03803 family)
VLFAFGGQPNAGSPASPLTYVDGIFYGTTQFGGAHNVGSVFSIDSKGVESVLHSFAGGADGLLPGYGALLNVGGVLYGTTAGDNATSAGNVFKIAPNGAESVVYSFGKNGDGNGPEAGLVDVDGVLYGTTSRGGANGTGTVFGITPGGTETLRYSFAGGKDGANPESTLINIDGVLYGTTAFGGALGDGTIFRVSPNGAEKVIFSFGGGNNGRNPFGGLALSNGSLYGTTTFGGAYSVGTVYSFTLGGSMRKLYDFGGPGAQGGLPGWGPLVPKPGSGVLYGTTMGGQVPQRGSQTFNGTVFSIDAAGRESTLHVFTAAVNGLSPSGGLFELSGQFFGTTQAGGAGGQGTVFSLTL